MPGFSNNPKMQVEVRGATLDELRSTAREHAAEFFGLEGDDFELKLDQVVARAEFYDSANRPVGFWARITVELVPMPTESAEPPPSPFLGPLTGSSETPVRHLRPVGPARTVAGEPFEWDDADDDTDDDATGLSDD